MRPGDLMVDLRSDTTFLVIAVFPKKRSRQVYGLGVVGKEGQERTRLMWVDEDDLMTRERYELMLGIRAREISLTKDML